MNGIEIERKFLIEYPDASVLSGCKRADIVQTYLCSPSDEEIRVRARTEGESTVYFKTVKKKLGGFCREELENEISESDYLELLKCSDPTRRPIEKTRYCLVYRDQCFEIDVYPFWTDKAIMEIELESEEQGISFPDGIRIIEEVTCDERYKNSSLARLK